MVRYLHILLLAGLVFGCESLQKNPSDITYFGGTIDNPKSDWVYLYKGEILVDSTVLDSNQSFLFSLPKEMRGLYKFVIKPEYQYIFFEPGDSLMVYLNTLEFDESLVFSGFGSERNNFLLDMFLENESDSEKIVGFYQLDAATFIKKMDSLQQLKTLKLRELKKKHALTPAFEKTAEGAINFINFRARELYPFINHQHLDENNPLPDDYYAFRKKVNLSDTIFESYYSFKNYLISFVDNLSFLDCLEDCKIDNQANRFSLHHNLHKLEMIDSVFENGETKDLLLMESAVDYLNKEVNSEHIAQYMTVFHNIDKGAAVHQKIETLAESAGKLSKGNPLPEITVADVQGRIFALNEKFHAPLSVVYFWDSNLQRHFKFAHNRIAELQKNHPNIAFYGISTSDNHTKWVKEAQVNQLDTQTEFRAADFNKLSDLLMIKNLSRTFVVDKNGLIINASSNLFDPAIEVLLAGN